MSQADATETGLSAEDTSPSAPPQHTDHNASQDVPAALTEPPVPEQPSLITESLTLTQSTAETRTEDTTATTKTSEGQTDQAEPAAGAQVIECDQAVSLDPDTEAVEEDVEVCRSSSSCVLIVFG